MEIVHVISFTLNHTKAIRDVLVCLRHSAQEKPGYSILLFCDLPDAPFPKLYDEDSLIRTLRNGIKSMNTSSLGSISLLVRSRVWDDAARAYLGSGQSCSSREVIAQLLVQGETSAAFEYTDIAPASMKGRWEAVLFSDLSVTCTPDTPVRMAAYLKEQSLSAVGAWISPHTGSSSSALSSVCAHLPFSLSPRHAAQEWRCLQQGQVSCSHPVLFTLEALSHIDKIQSVFAVPQCCFCCRHAPDLPAVFLNYQRLCRIYPLSSIGVPLLQLALLCTAAVWGIPLFAVCALIPELWAVLHPRIWSGVLLRTALLPITVLHALDMLLCRLLARSPLLRLRVPKRLFSPLFGLFFALALLAAAFISVYALTAVMPFAFLWLCMPILYPALDQVDDGAAAPIHA